MSLISSLYTGTTGLETNTQDLSIIGDNIANANTIGFKESRAAFEDQLSQQLLGAGQVGLGAKLQLSQRIFTQGSLTSTGIATDLALEGPGLFAIKGTHNGVTSTFYTRDGKFQQDKDGYLVNLEGLRVQGYQADSSGNITGTIGDLAIGGAQANPKASANITLKANLKADSAVLAAAWDPANPTTTSNFSTGVTIYDSLGTVHQVSIYFRKTADGAWDWHGLVDGADQTGGTAGTPSEIASGTLSFDSSGALSAITQTSNFNPTKGAVNPQPLTFNFGSPTSATPPGSGLDGVKQSSSDSAVTFTSQDGYTSGQLSSLKVDTQGNVLGSFTNGQSRNLGQVAVASFSAPDRLERAAGNLLAETAGSGNASFGTAGTGGRGSVSGGALEQSNVDLASEFVRMISAQRGFQANSKTINTADQLLQELIQLKR
jgi:flagellar hook protein FlgE